MNVIVERCGWVLVHSWWQLALVALATVVALRCLRRAAATTRYAVLAAALVGVILTPCATWFALARADGWARRTNEQRLGIVTVDRADRADSTGKLEQDSTAASERGGDPLGTGHAHHVESAASAQSASAWPLSLAAWRESLVEQLLASLRPWLNLIVAVWGAGVGVCSVRPLAGWWMLYRLRRVGVTQASAAVRESVRRLSQRMGVSRLVAIGESSLTRVPLVLGYFRPIILLPVGIVANLSVAQLEAILAHELAHVRRHDFVVNLVQAVVETLFFYHPAVWWLSRRLRTEREYCCDDVVMRVCGNRLEYGRALVAVEELRAAAPVLALGAADGELLARVRRIVGGDAVRLDRTVDRWPLSIAASLSLVVVGTLGMAATAADRGREVSAFVVAVAPAAPGDAASPDENPQTLRGGVSASLASRWEVKLGRPVSASAAIAGNRVFVPCESGELACLNTRDGSRVWSYWSSLQPQREDSASFRAAPLVTDDTVYLGDEDGVFHAVDRAQGTRRWTFATADRIAGAPAIAGDFVLVGSYDKHVYALKRADGNVAWKFATDSHVHAAPQVIGDDVLVVGCDGHLRVLDLKLGTQKRDVVLGEHLAAKPVVVGNVAYVGSFGGEFVAVDWKKGEVLWKYVGSRDGMVSSPAITDRLVIFGVRDKRLYGLDRATGKLVWQATTSGKIDSSPLTRDGRVFVGSEDGNLYEFDAATGERRAKYLFGAPVTASPVLFDNLLVVGCESHDGKVIGFSRMGAEMP